MAIFTLPGPSTAQGDSRIPVMLSISAKDTVGKRLAYYVRDELGRSGSFASVDEDYGRGFKLELVTIDPGSDGNQTAYSLVILIYNKDGFDSYITNYVGHCGVQRVRECAQGVLESLGEQVETLRQIQRERALR